MSLLNVISMAQETRGCTLTLQNVCMVFVVQSWLEVKGRAGIALA